MDAADLARENMLLKARLAEVEAALADAQEAQQRLESIVTLLRREKFGARSEQLSPDQFNLPLEGEPPRRHRFEPGGERAGAGRAGGGAGEGRGRPRQGEGRERRAAAQPRSPAGASASGGAGDRAREHPLPVWLRRDGEDRRGRLGTARRDPGTVPGAGDPSSQIRLPPLLGGRCAGPCPGARRAGRTADRAPDRAGDRLEVRRPPAVLPPGRHLPPAGHRA